MECDCNLCLARKYSCSTIEIYFGRTSVMGRFVRRYKGLEIWQYEDIKRKHKNRQKQQWSFFLSNIILS